MAELKDALLLLFCTDGDERESGMLRQVFSRLVKGVVITDPLGEEGNYTHFSTQMSHTTINEK